MGCRCTLMENLLSGLSGYCRDLWLISGSRSSKPTENYFFVEESNLLMDMVSVGLDWGYITSCWVTNIWVTGCIVSSCVGTNMQVNAASQADKLYWPALCMRADLLSGWVNNSTLCQLELGTLTQLRLLAGDDHGSYTTPHYDRPPPSSSSSPPQACSNSTNNKYVRYFSWLGVRLWKSWQHWMQWKKLS